MELHRVNGPLAICLGSVPRQLMLQTSLPTPTPGQFLFLSPSCSICDEAFNDTLIQMLCFFLILCHFLFLLYGWVTLTAPVAFPRQTVWLMFMKRRAFKVCLKRSQQCDNENRTNTDWAYPFPLQCHQLALFQPNQYGPWTHATAWPEIITVLYYMKDK